MEKLALLPSARLVPLELRPDFGPIPSAMIPLGSRPALDHICSAYATAGIPSLIAIHEGAHLIRTYLKMRPALNAESVDVGETHSLGETIAQSLRNVTTPRTLVIHFADTLLPAGRQWLDDGGAPDFICYQERSDVYRWTTFDVGPDGNIRGVVDKETAKLRPGKLFSFIGVFSFSRPVQFISILEQCIADPDPGLDPFYSAVIEYFNDLHPTQKRLIPVEDWTDVGHLDTYYRAKLSGFLNNRAFNSLSVDLRRGIIRKSSKNEAKLRNEIEYYLHLPSDLQYLVPRVFSHSMSAGNTSVEMEFYGYPALNDVYLYGEWDLGVWSQALEAVGAALDAMSTHRADLGSTHHALYDMYVNKTKERVTPLLSAPQFQVFMGDSVTINGRLCMGLEAALHAIPQILQSVRVFDSQEFTIIHGDLCLSNILYDRRSGVVRLVDPRGSFGGIDMYGDPRYELAKLSHSLEGDYDFLVNGFFEFRADEDGISLEVRHRRTHRAIKQLFRSWILKRAGNQYQQVKCIEALLFLSMVDLHWDRPASQMAFLARGLETLQDVSEAITSRPIQEAPVQYATSVHDYHHDGR